MSRTVLVTGGGTGIGKAVAREFLALGDRVVITGRRPQALAEAAADLGGDRISTEVCDHTDPAALEALRDRLAGEVQVLVNNAGGNLDLQGPPPGDLAALAERWRTNLEANLLAAVLTTAAVDKQLTEGGTVVNIGSFAADRGAGSYGAAKAAMNTWNMALARELGPRGLTANVLAPGYIDNTEFFHGRKTDEFHANRVAETAVKRAGAPEDVARVAVFLASPAARHITGQVLRVDGGVITTR